MVGLETIAATLTQTVTAESAGAGVRALAGKAGRRRRRAAACDAFESSIDRVRLRIEIVSALASTSANFANVVMGLSAWRVLAELLDQIMVDTAELLACARHVRANSDAATATAADDLVVSLGEVLTVTDPGWLHPSKRRKFRTDRAHAVEEYNRQRREFALLVRQGPARRRWWRRG
ncbi:MAG TPA: hypothetical protein VFQ85_17150 [Mycobacteriales bacterium]|jgi:hypothetical protein|nr:hypothetical protein [Mycobacteriales bacterium]